MTPCGVWLANEQYRALGHHKIIDYGISNLNRHSGCNFLMGFKISDHQARYLRMSAQGIFDNHPGPLTQAATVVKNVVGVQAQDDGAAFLSIHARSSGLKATTVEKELFQERSMVRSWFMRGTLHLIATHDLDWLLPLLAPVFIKKNLRRYAQLGLDEAAIHRGVQRIREQLASCGPLTRHELASGIVQQGVNIAGQALFYLINRAAWEGVLCLGPMVGGKQTYALLCDWIGRELTIGLESAGELLVKRYLAAYGPASLKDFVSWSGLPTSLVKETWVQLQDRLIEVEFPRGGGFILADQADGLDELSPDSLGVHLLPMYDTFLLGYADREFYVAGEYLKKVNAGGGILRPVLLVDGHVQGIWGIKHDVNGVIVQVEPFKQLSASHIKSLDAEVDGIGRFLDVEARLQI
jgi:hypothetical protein